MIFIWQYEFCLAQDRSDHLCCWALAQRYFEESSCDDSLCPLWTSEHKIVLAAAGGQPLHGQNRAFPSTSQTAPAEPSCRYVAWGCTGVHLGLFWGFFGSLGKMQVLPHWTTPFKTTRVSKALWHTDIVVLITAGFPTEVQCSLPRQSLFTSNMPHNTILHDLAIINNFNLYMKK